MDDPRELGNKYFFERKYEQALDCYSEAIALLGVPQRLEIERSVLPHIGGPVILYGNIQIKNLAKVARYLYNIHPERNGDGRGSFLHRVLPPQFLDVTEKNTPSMPTLYTNRALCCLKLENWSQVVQDCEKAVQLDPSVIKAHFYKGQALVELGKYDGAIVSLKKAYELSKQQRKNFGEDITSAVRYAKKKRWAELEQQRLRDENEFHSLLSKLLSDHRDRELAEIDMTLSAEEMTDKVDMTHKEHERRELLLAELFQEADKRRKLREVPDHLCGKISFELMTDPCITPSGITYNRKDIEEHLQRVGHFDPVTRQKLTQDQLIANLAMKEVTDAFTAENQWVEDY